VIRIRKPARPPAVLQTRGLAARDALCAAYDAGARTFTFDRALYAHADVKAALLAAQHDKCCFCEAKLPPTTTGDVEHFRPKGTVRPSADAPDETPGYYWLAYDWANLFVACGVCNRSYKRTLFPLRDPSARARSHRDDLEDEAPLLLHPSDDDPERAFIFDAEVIRPRPGDARARTTIRVLGLDREPLELARRKRYDIIEQMRLVARLDTPQREAARAFLRDAVRDDAEYAAMARAALTP
jgi:uncharacterized protein (TIGR02646 family)